MNIAHMEGNVVMPTGRVRRTGNFNLASLHVDAVNLAWLYDCRQSDGYGAGAAPETQDPHCRLQVPLQIAGMGVRVAPVQQLQKLGAINPWCIGGPLEV